MFKIKIHKLLLKYGISVLVEMILSICGLVSVLSIYKLYKTTLLFYFILYNVIISAFAIFHFVRVFKDLMREEIDDVVYVKMKLIFMIMSFIWGVVILEHSNIMYWYHNNYPSAYASFISYFILSGLYILQTIYKISVYLYDLSQGRQTYTVINSYEYDKIITSKTTGNTYNSSDSSDNNFDFIYQT
jgi:hypothetical protein